MKRILRKDITDIFDKMGVIHTVREPKKGTEMYSGHDTMFMITKDNNLIYFSDFEVCPDEIGYEINGNMYFMTPMGDLSHDWVELNLSIFIKEDLWDTFIIQPEDVFEYTDLDVFIRVLMDENKPVQKVVTSSHLSDFVKSEIEIL